MASFSIKDLEDVVARSDDAFDQRVADNTVNRLDIPGGYDYNTERHRFLADGTLIQDPANTDRLIDADGKFQILAAAGETNEFRTREILRYVPNYEILWGAAVWAESALSDGQHFAIEYTDDNGDNGYSYVFDGTADGLDLTLEQYRGGSTVDSYNVIVGDDFQGTDLPQYDHTKPAVYRCFVNWYGGGATRYTVSYPVTDDAGDAVAQDNHTLGRTANRDDIATDRINNHISVRVWADEGADEVTVNLGSLGALIRGNATEFDREKTPVIWDVGGSISQYPVDNVDDAIAARVARNKTEVAVTMLPPSFKPAGNDVYMELGAYVIDRLDPDLTVNFDDPDDDGTDEGPAPAAQGNALNDVMRYTRNVTAIPTETDIRSDGTTGLVPNMTLLATTVAESGQGSGGGSQTGGERPGVKRNVGPDDVIIFLPRTDPSGGTTNGRIRWMSPVFEEDW